MSHDDLLAVQAAHAFDDAPKRDELGRYHVPFQDIAGTTRIEDNLLAASRRRERLAIVGDSGSGKSSLINGSLGPLAPDIAPVVVPVSAEPRDTITEPRSMFAIIGRSIVRQARAAATLSDRGADSALAERPMPDGSGKRPNALSASGSASSAPRSAPI